VRGSQQPQRAADYHTTLNKTPRTSLSKQWHDVGVHRGCHHRVMQPLESSGLLLSIRTTLQQRIRPLSQQQAGCHSVSSCGHWKDARQAGVGVCCSLTDIGFAIHVTRTLFTPKLENAGATRASFADHLKIRQNGPGLIEEKAGRSYKFEDSRPLHFWQGMWMGVKSRALYMSYQV
jgi:hypothetical protein